jgi:hypothetical protein
MCCPRTPSGKNCCCRPKATRSARPEKGADCCGTPKTGPGEERQRGGANGAERRCCTKIPAASGSLPVVPRRTAPPDDVRPSGNLPAAPALVRAPWPGPCSSFSAWPTPPVHPPTSSHSTAGSSFKPAPSLRVAVVERRSFVEL